jgi:hypothetical protein
LCYDDLPTSLGFADILYTMNIGIFPQLWFC